jgi:glycosyltransferase involved in cell wall biosynthesis
MCYRNRTIGVVVPAFNEAQLIGNTLNSIPKYVDRLCVVDDCSSDRTAEIAREFGKIDQRVTCISHEKNSGVGAAIVSGYKMIIGEGIDIVAVMARDDQMDPKYLPDLINPIIDEKADFTKGNRLKPGYWIGMSKWRLSGNFLLSALNKIASGYWNIDDPQNGYVCVSSASLRKLNLDNLYKGYAFENDMMVKANVAGLRMMNVLIPAKYGQEKSKIKYNNFIYLTSLFLLYSFIWRIWRKYLIKFHPLGILFMAGLFGIFFGIIFLVNNIAFLFIGTIIFLLACALDFWQNSKLHCRCAVCE